MKTDFIIKAIDPRIQREWFTMKDSELEVIGIRRSIVDEFPGYPCRISLEDAKPGEEVLLFTFEHHSVSTPYRSAGPIFIRKDALKAELAINEIPKMLRHRLLSLRAYNKEGMMVDARTQQGRMLREEIKDVFSLREVSYIHLHNAGPGCYNCTVERVN
ncbi:MAG: DUF1203 domain-containing protein [Flavobacteriaceae bacterium]